MRESELRRSLQQGRIRACPPPADGYVAGPAEPGVAVSRRDINSSQSSSEQAPQAACGGRAAPLRGLHPAPRRTRLNMAMGRATPKPTPRAMGSRPMPAARGGGGAGGAAGCRPYAVGHAALLTLLKVL
jgi:hypothetical protein